MGVQRSGIGDVGIDVVLRRTGGKIGGAFRAGDGTPWVQCTARMRHFASALSGSGENADTVL